jgi:hypothetical protein
VQTNAKTNDTDAKINATSAKTNETNETNEQTNETKVITHSSIAILLIWLMKPNVFELRAPISKVAMPGCYSDLVNLCACGCFISFWDVA